MNQHLLGLFLVTLFVAMIVPGPDMMLVLVCGTRGGPRAGFFAALGVATSVVVHVAVAAAGLSALFAAAPDVFLVVRLCGAAYLLYLGACALRSAWRGSPLDEAELVTRGLGRRQAYGRGFLTNLINPKMVTFTVALLPQFIDHSLGHMPLQFAVLGAIFVVFEVVIDGGVGVTAGLLGNALTQRRRARQALDVGSGTIMIGLAGRLAMDSKTV